MFDAPCGQCEYEDYERELAREWEAMPEEEKRAIIEASEAWQREQKNKYLDSEIPF
jgi:hypothetical protein